MLKGVDPEKVIHIYYVVQTLIDMLGELVCKIDKEEDSIILYIHVLIFTHYFSFT